MLCIQRTLAKGRRSGFVSGLGAASADAVYGSIVGFGFTALSSLLLEYRTEIRVGGGLLLLALGVRALRSTPTETTTPTSGTRGLASDYGSTFLLTVANPMTIVAFVGLFAGSGVGVSGTPLDRVTLVVGVFAGSACWWLVLIIGVSSFGTRITRSRLRQVNRFAGAVIAGFGLLVVWSVL